MEGNEKATNDTSNNNGSVSYYPRDKGIREAVENLVDAVLNSETYKRYQEANRLLSARPELKAEISEYRKEVFLVQAGREKDFGAIKKIEMASDKYHEDPLTDEYLNSEIAMCRVFQRINYMLLDKVGFEQEFEL